MECWTLVLCWGVTANHSKQHCPLVEEQRFQMNHQFPPIPSYLQSSMHHSVSDCNVKVILSVVMLIEIRWSFEQQVKKSVVLNTGLNNSTSVHQNTS